IAVIQARIASLRERIPAGQTYSVVRWMPQGPMAMSEKLIAGQILTALGLKSTDVAASLGERPHSDILSLENLAGVDADWMFIATLNEQGDATLAAAQKQPAFNRLKAVRNDRAFPADGHVWSSATGALAAERILDDVERILLKRWPQRRSGCGYAQPAFYVQRSWSPWRWPACCWVPGSWVSLSRF